EPEEEGDENDIEQFLLHGVGAHPFLRHEVRKLILGRLVRRQMKRPRKRRAGKAHDSAAEPEEQHAAKEERRAKTKNWVCTRSWRPPLQRPSCGVPIRRKEANVPKRRCRCRLERRR